MKWLYLIIDIGAVLIPVIYSFHPKIGFYKYWKAAFSAILITASFFLIWDQLFTVNGVWKFNERYVTGAYFFHLPLEEVLFFICIPYACLFTYYSLKKLVFKDSGNEVSVKWVYSFSLVFLLFAIFYLNRLYTFYTFLFLSLTFLLCRNYLRKNILTFFKQYLILLVPMFIVNGILTGTGIEEEVVWYNDIENSGFRIGTIPIEDFFYGMIFILLNVFLFEKFRSKSNQKEA